MIDDVSHAGKEIYSELSIKIELVILNKITPNEGAVHLQFSSIKKNRPRLRKSIVSVGHLAMLCNPIQFRDFVKGEDEETLLTFFWESMCCAIMKFGWLLKEEIRISNLRKKNVGNKITKVTVIFKAIN